MTIRAKYDDGVFKPLDDVKLAEGTLVKISVPVEAPRERPKSVRDWPAFGMWADRDDIAGVVLKPPVSLDELKTDTEDDPEGAEEFVALIRALRKEGSRPVAL